MENLLTAVLVILLGFHLLLAIDLIRHAVAALLRRPTTMGGAADHPADSSDGQEQTVRRLVADN